MTLHLAPAPAIINYAASLLGESHALSNHIRCLLNSRCCAQRTSLARMGE